MHREKGIDTLHFKLKSLYKVFNVLGVGREVERDISSFTWKSLQVKYTVLNCSIFTGFFFFFF